MSGAVPAPLELERSNQWTDYLNDQPYKPNKHKPQGDTGYRDQHLESHLTLSGDLSAKSRTKVLGGHLSTLYSVHFAQ